jgi:hypothetical protein
MVCLSLLSSFVPMKFCFTVGASSAWPEYVNRTVVGEYPHPYDDQSASNSPSFLRGGVHVCTYHLTIIIRIRVEITSRCSGTTIISVNFLYPRISNLPCIRIRIIPPCILMRSIYTSSIKKTTSRRMTASHNLPIGMPRARR